jgi:hypothetical protein
MKKVLLTLFWLLTALLGVWGYATLATQRGEPLNSVYVLLAALCSYAIGYRFYSKWVAARVLTLNDRRATPCEVQEDGKDYVKTNKVDRVRASFCRDLRSRAVGGSRFGRAIRLFAGCIMDSDRSGIGRGGAGFCYSLFAPCAATEVPWARW